MLAHIVKHILINQNQWHASTYRPRERVALATRTEYAARKSGHSDLAREKFVLVNARTLPHAKPSERPSTSGQSGWAARRRTKGGEIAGTMPAAHSQPVSRSSSALRCNNNKKSLRRKPLKAHTDRNNAETLHKSQEPSSTLWSSRAYPVCVLHTPCMGLVEVCTANTVNRRTHSSPSGEVDGTHRHKVRTLLQDEQDDEVNRSERHRKAPKGSERHRKILAVSSAHFTSRWMAWQNHSHPSTGRSDGFRFLETYGASERANECAGSQRERR